MAEQDELQSQGGQTGSRQFSPPEDGGKSPQESRQELQEAVRGSNDVLVTATTLLTLFPDTITLDRAKLTVFKRTFFSSAEVVSMRIEDVLNVTASIGPFLGSVKISSRVVNADSYVVGKFSRTDTLKVKRIAQGYVIALQREIDCSALPTNDLVNLLYKLGEDDHATS